MKLSINAIAKVKNSLTAKKKNKILKNEDLLSTGSDLLNLACTGRIAGGFPAGKYIHLVGDSESGKTFIANTCFAEAQLKSRFKNYRIIYDDPEDGAMMDKVRFFGSRVASKVEPAAGTREDPIASATVEAFYDNVDNALKKGQPFIYILDSNDALDCAADQKKRAKNKSARANDREESGSFGTAKAKVHSENLKRIRYALRKSGSILIIISQTRDTIGFGSQFNPKSVSGGKALKFYCDLQIWTATKTNLTKSIKGKNRQVGIITQAHIKKNRVNGKKRVVEFPIYHSFGIDNTGSLIDYLCDENYWKFKGGKKLQERKILAPEFSSEYMRREDLIIMIEENNDEEKLKDLVVETWNEIEQRSKIRRKKRYE